MPNDVGVLCAAALSIAFLHTLFGPDHYVPFVAMSQVGKWSLRKTVVVTLLCGLAHVGSSVVLGLIGVACGLILFQLETVEQLRGELAGWLLLAFGLVYFCWGVVQAVRNVPHTHLHAHTDGTVHVHEHTHQGEHLHAHSHELVEDASQQGFEARSPASAMTPWVLFVVFLFGPCEPLIPLLMYPAAEANVWAVLAVTALFSLTTLVTMTTIVVAMYLGAAAARFDRLHRYGHALAGFTILCCGLAVKLGM